MSSLNNSEVLLPDSLGIVAGSGQLPIHLAAKARDKFERIVGAVHVGETSDSFLSLCDSTVKVKIGQLGKIISFFKKNGATKIVFAGGISRPSLLRGNLWPDARGLSLLLKVGSVKDDIILRAIAAEFEKEGMEVISVGEILKDFIPSVGTLTKRKLNVEEQKDAVLGWQTAKLIGQADIGQSVVISQGMIVAVEAVEGTDAAIKRGGELSAGRGGIVVKTCKPHQDERLDLPTIGLNTIRNIKAAGLTALVIEAGKSLILNPEETIKEADNFGLSIEAR